MDLFKILPQKDWKEFTENYNYKTNTMGAKLFPAQKTPDIELSVMQLVEGGNIPVMARVHAFDTEAHMGDRPNAETVKYEKLLIKEKINQTERIAQFLNNAPESKVIDFIFNDAANMIQRVQTRTEVASMELLGTGKATYKENNVSKIVDYNVSKHPISGWNKPDHDIIGDIETIKLEAKNKGYNLVRAITSTKIIQYMLKNTAILGYWANVPAPLTENRLVEWLKDNFGIEFVANDEVYKESALASATHRFFPEEAVTFLATRGTVGIGFYGYTPEELSLPDTSEKSLVTITQWKTEDPVATWIKGSALYVPAPKDSKSIFVCKHTAG